MGLYVYTAMHEEISYGRRNFQTQRAFEARGVLQGASVSRSGLRAVTSDHAGRDVLPSDLLISEGALAYEALVRRRQ